MEGGAILLAQADVAYSQTVRVVVVHAVLLLVAVTAALVLLGYLRRKLFESRTVRPEDLTLEQARQFLRRGQITLEEFQALRERVIERNKRAFISESNDEARHRPGPRVTPEAATRDDGDPVSKPARKPKPIRKPRRRRRVLLVIVLFLVAFVVLADLAWRFLEATSTNAFCASCHEMDGAVKSWRASTHYTNASGMHVNCVDCHLPPKDHLLRFVWEKGATGTRDVALHLAKRPYDAKAWTERLLKEMPDSRCLGCHPELFSPEMSLEAHIAHSLVLFPEDGNVRNCLSCHPEVGHRRPPLAPPPDMKEQEEKAEAAKKAAEAAAAH